MPFLPYANDCLGGADARRDPSLAGAGAACRPGRYALAWSAADYELAAEAGYLPQGFVPPGGVKGAGAGVGGGKGGSGGSGEEEGRKDEL